MSRLRRYEITTSFLVLLLFFIYLYNTYISFFNLENIRSLLDYLGYFGPVVFILVFIILALLGFPVSLLYFFTGFAFGLSRGYFISVFAALVSAIIAFNISRKIMRNFVHHTGEQKKKRFTDKLIEKIRASAKNRGFLNILILRLYFMPYIELSYAAGLVRELRQKEFLLATFLVNFLETFIFIFLGASVFESIYLFLVAIALVLTFISIPRLFRHHSLNLHFRKH